MRLKNIVVALLVTALFFLLSIYVQARQTDVRNESNDQIAGQNDKFPLIFTAEH